MLKLYIDAERREAGCDEAGRGPLAGPVTAAAVLLPPDYRNDAINDSKQLTEKSRRALRAEIEAAAEAWAVAWVDAEGIDKLNILHASTHAMCMAARVLLGEQVDNTVGGGRALGKAKPEHLLVDGNRFYNETGLGYTCIVKGDAQYLPIAAASILAKTYRDEAMERLHEEFPCYGWDHNKGYPTEAHYRAIEEHGISPYHRRSFNLYRQHTLFE